MKVCFVGYFVPGRISGPSDSVINLAKHLVGLADSVVVVSSNKSASAVFEMSGVPIFPWHEAFSCIEKSDVVVLCGVYDLQVLRMCRLSHKLGKPYVISARGNLTKASQKKSYIKKLVYRKFLIGRVLKKSAAIHFLTDDEESASLHLGVKSFVVPNGVHLPDLGSYRAKGDRYDRTIVFLGRLDVYHKGIDVVLKAVSILKDEFRGRGWKVRFFGPGFSPKDQKWIGRFVSSEGITDIVSFLGPVHGEDKFLAIGEGRFFIHASRYEGQPQSVIQAMAVGSIPLISKGCNLDSLNEQYQFAIGIGSTLESLVSSMRELFELEVDELDRLSKINRNVVAECFKWEKVARDFHLNLSDIVR